MSKEDKDFGTIALEKILEETKKITPKEFCDFHEKLNTKILDDDMESSGLDIKDVYAISVDEIMEI